MACLAGTGAREVSRKPHCHGRELVQRQLALVELDGGDEKRYGPVRLIVEDLLESGPSVLAPEVHVDRLAASDLGEGEGTHARRVIRPVLPGPVQTGRSPSGSSRSHRRRRREWSSVTQAQ